MSRQNLSSSPGACESAQHGKRVAATKRVGRSQRIANAIEKLVLSLSTQIQNNTRLLCIFLTVLSLVRATVHPLIDPVSDHILETCAKQVDCYMYIGEEEIESSEDLFL